MRKETPMSKKNTIIPFALKDVVKDDSILKGRIEVNEQGIFINLEGYGEKVSPQEQSFPIMVELHDGQPRVIVWSNINIEGATHDVKLGSASEEKRAPEPRKGGLTATFRPQASINDNCVDVDGKFDFDITEQILKKTPEEIKAFEENNYDSDSLADDFNDHDGPFEVDTDLDAWFEEQGVEGGRKNLTWDDLNRLRKKFGIKE